MKEMECAKEMTKRVTQYIGHRHSQGRTITDEEVNTFISWMIREEVKMNGRKEIK